MKKNILIVDDSALMRRVLSDIINKNNKFSVTEVAKNGEDALKILQERAKDIHAMVVDIHMPKMNGVELLKHINAYKIHIKTIVISAIATEDTEETIEALELGAFDFIEKPNALFGQKNEVFAQKLIECLELATGSTIEKAVSKPIAASHIQPAKINHQKNKVLQSGLEAKGSVVRGNKLVALACSTGGPKALQKVIPLLPCNLDAPMLVVQHMPAGFTKSLANRLNELSDIHVKEAEDGEVLKKGVVYIAQGGLQLRVLESNGEFRLSERVEEARNGLKPCADIMYESLVGKNYEEITCVVLTGMGSDGTQGIKQLSKKNNIYTIAQNAATCTVYGMPKMIAQSGLVNEVLPLEKIAGAIRTHVGVQ